MSYKLINGGQREYPSSRTPSHGCKFGTQLDQRTTLRLQKSTTYAPSPQMPHELLWPRRDSHIVQIQPHLHSRLPRQALAYPTHRGCAWFRGRRELRFDLRTARVIDGGSHGCLAGVCALREELEAALLTRDDRMTLAEDVVRTMLLGFRKVIPVAHRISVSEQDCASKRPRTHISNSRR